MCWNKIKCFRPIIKSPAGLQGGGGPQGRLEHAAYKDSESNKKRIIYLFENHMHRSISPLDSSTQNRRPFNSPNNTNAEYTECLCSFKTSIFSRHVYHAVVQCHPRNVIKRLSHAPFLSNILRLDACCRLSVFLMG